MPQAPVFAGEGYRQVEASNFVACQLYVTMEAGYSGYTMKRGSSDLFVTYRVNVSPGLTHNVCFPLPERDLHRVWRQESRPRRFIIEGQVAENGMRGIRFLSMEIDEGLNVGLIH